MSYDRVHGNRSDLAMHTPTEAIEQHTAAIKQRLDEAGVRVAQHLELTMRRFILRMTLIFGAALIVSFALYKLT